MKQFEINWHQRGGPPRSKPNPLYPHGIDLDLSDGASRTCTTALPYPTEKKVLGMLMIHCTKCGLLGTVTTAGRPDDPRSIKLACKGKHRFDA